MANCHFDQHKRPVPVAVVTNLDGEIIYKNESTTYDHKDTKDRTMNQIGYQPLNVKYDNWCVSGARIMITRFWASSTATIVLVPNIPNQFATPAPLHPQARQPEQDVCIWLGYIDSVRPVEKKDLESNNLIRCYVGIIENIKTTSTAQGGHTVHLQCRDRVKWLMNSTVYFSAEQLVHLDLAKRSRLVYEVANKGIGIVIDDNKTEPVKGQGKDRHFVWNEKYVLDIANNVKGGVKSSAKNTSQADKGAARVTEVSTDFAPNAWYKNGLLSGRTTNTSLKVDLNPEFRIISTRLVAPGKKDRDDRYDLYRQFIIKGTQPIDTIKSLAFQEIFPFEVFQDHRDGHIYYVPRGLDKTSLTDENRFKRVYYFNQDDDYFTKDINVNQRLIGFREEYSSIGLKTNFLVSIEQVQGEKQWDDYQVHLEMTPRSIGLPNPNASTVNQPYYAKKMHHITDPSITTATEATAVALSLARIWGRAVHAGMSVILGDPSISPGEVVQIIGSNIFQDVNRYNNSDADKDRAKEIKNFNQFADRYDEEFVQVVSDAAVASQSASSGTEKKPDSLQMGGLKVPVEKVDIESSNDPGSAHTALNKTLWDPNDDVTIVNPQLPRSIFRVEAVAHKFNLGSRGFTTELALVTPY